MFAAALILTFIVTVLISKKLIPILKSRKMGQTILEIGPRWHKSKEGTPTMGGLAFIFAVVIAGVAASVYLALTDGIRSTLPFMFTLALGVVNGLIGCVDDAAKLKKKQNEGLTAPQKFLLQLVSGALYLLGMTLVCGVDTTIYIPFVGAELDFGIFYYLIAILHVKLNGCVFV
jgi:phospho-N-acetylmuramoyl-pentapeptide-transferase